MATSGPRRATTTVECPKSMVGRVIGKNGETIKALQSYSGALIQIDQTVEPTKVTISGTPHSLSLAVSMVTDIVKGTFKGFALLRQVTSPANLRGSSSLRSPGLCTLLAMVLYRRLSCMEEMTELLWCLSCNVSAGMPCLPGSHGMQGLLLPLRSFWVCSLLATAL